MLSSDKKIRLWIGCASVISAAILLAWQSSVMAEHERDSLDARMAAIIKEITTPVLIVVPEPDPAFYGNLLLDQAMARSHLVPLGK